jgi:hypothetical protein
MYSARAVSSVLCAEKAESIHCSATLSAPSRRLAWALRSAISATLPSGRHSLRTISAMFSCIVSSCCSIPDCL